jgi:hypothetical protein
MKFPWPLFPIIEKMLGIRLDLDQALCKVMASLFTENLGSLLKSYQLFNDIE